jgi:hypothetical protein
MTKINERPTDEERVYHLMVERERSRWCRNYNVTILRWGERGWRVHDGDNDGFSKEEVNTRNKKRKIGVTDLNRPEC